LISTLLLAALGAGAGQVSINYDQFSGLSVDVAGVRLVAGSGFQYYEPGWKAGIYSSRWQPKTVTSTPNEITVRYQGRNRAVLGTVKYTLEGNDVAARYEFQWNGDREARIENCFGLLWASAFKDARAESNEIRRSRFFEVPMAEDSVWTRALAIGTRALFFDAPFGRMSITSNVPFIVFDGRNYPQDWARGRPVHWAGSLSHSIKPGGRVTYSVRMSFSRLFDRPASTEAVGGIAARLERAQEAQPPMPVLPTPRSLVFREGAVRTNGSFRLRASDADLASTAERHLNGRVSKLWHLEGGEPTDVEVLLEGTRPAEWYSMSCSAGTVRITAGGTRGLEHAVERLAQLVRSDDSGLCLPNFSITGDAPLTPWRGVHLFVGPRALEFQTRLMDRLLAPLRFNHVVLQCERTDWESLPGARTAAR
jgi:hypothetical protein